MKITLDVNCTCRYINNSTTKGKYILAKTQKTIRISGTAINMVQQISDSSDNQYDSWTDALENMIRNSHAVHSIPSTKREKLRVSCKKGPHADDYEEHDREMISFFWV